MHTPDQADVAYAVDYVLERAASFGNADHDEIVIETSLDGNAAAARGRHPRERARRAPARTWRRARRQLRCWLPTAASARWSAGARTRTASSIAPCRRARQPGSTFKPVVYLTAVESGLTPDSVVKDEPIVLKGWAPKNDNGRYLGTTTLREALSHSINSVAVRLLLDAGLTRVAATAQRPRHEVRAADGCIAGARARRKSRCSS